MLEIVLLILKIAGIILAAILGILIVGLCCALFVPVRYRGDFSISDGKDEGKKNVDAVLRAVWLLRLVRVYVSYKTAVRVQVKVFFFTVMDTAKEKKGREKKRKRAGEETCDNVTEQKSEEESHDDALMQKPEEESHDDALMQKLEEESCDDAAVQKSEGEAEDGHPDDKSGKKDGENRTKDQSGSKEKTGIKKRISNILQTIRNFCDKLKKIKDKTEEIKEFWNSGHMVSSRSLLGRQFSYLLKHTKPKKLTGYLRFGFDNPAATGYVMAVYGILCAVWRPKLSVEPDFEKQILDCHVVLRGKIRVWHFVRVALRLLISRDVRRVIKDAKKL